MQKLEIEANIRTGKPNSVRFKGSIPAIVYGQGIEPVQIEVDKKRVSSFFSKGANKNALISLNVKNAGKTQTIPVLPHDMQIDPMTDQIMHIDFLKINMEEEIRTKISISFVGEPQGVKLDGGILVHSLRQLEIKCLPGNIPDKITVDVSSLNIGQSLKVSDIVPPSGITIVTPKDEPVAIVTQPSKDEEPVVAAAAAEGAVAEAGAEGAAAAGAEGAAAAPAAGAADAKAKAAPADDAKAKAPQKPQK